MMFMFLFVIIYRVHGFFKWCTVVAVVVVVVVAVVVVVVVVVVVRLLSLPKRSIGNDRTD